MAAEGRAQPRAISSDLALVPVYRAGLRLELQKFGNSKRDDQLSLWQLDTEEQDEPGIMVSGLDLSVTEDRALSALQILLDKTGYKGNRPAVRADSPRYHWQGDIPRLSITLSDFFEAYGLARAGDGRYRGHQADEALEALRGLATEPRSIYYERPKWAGGKKRLDVIRIKTPIIKLAEISAWQDLEEDEAERVLAGEEVLEKRRATGLVVDFTPLLVDQIDSFYLLKPVTLHKEILDYLGKRRVSRSVSLFIEWLLTKNTATVRIRKELLAERLRLQKYIKQRQWYRIDPLLQEAVETAKGLQYLNDAIEDPPGMFTFWLNPARCSRVQGRPEAETEAEEET